MTETRTLVANVGSSVLKKNRIMLLLLLLS